MFSTLIIMERMDAAPEAPLPLRARVREAGGWYAFLNARLIKLAGPAAVGPYETTPAPSVAERAERACPLCGHAMTEHTFDRTGPKPILHCP
jgi:hypothetical protein